MARRFSHLGEEWEAEATGIGIGVATGYIPKARHWGVVFTSLTKQSTPKLEGSISQPAPENVSEEELKRALEVGLVAHAIDSSELTWCTVDALSRQTSMPPERVRQILETLPIHFVRSTIPAKDGRELYSTRRRYRSDRSFLQTVKKCPFCAEEIQDEAIKCRHCGEMLQAATPTAAITHQGSPVLRVIGAFMFILGAATAVYYNRFFDTSVQTQTVTIFGQTVGGERVHNIGLMQDRQDGLMLGALGSVVGLGLLLYAQKRGR